MGDLFRIDTDRILLEWSARRDRVPLALEGISPPPGRLILRPKRHHLRFGSETWRSDVPKDLANNHAESVGPRLFEQTDYVVVLRGKEGVNVGLEHGDPSLLRDVKSSRSGDVLHGVVNFGSQVGRSTFLIKASGEPELEFEVEVFPTKLDYRKDYTQLVWEVQEVLTGLALEYLRSTFQLGSPVQAKQPSHLEWLTLLREVLDTLERALIHIFRQPVRETSRETESIRVDRVRRIDPLLRRQVVRQAGSGPATRLASDIGIHCRMPGISTKTTIDTPEHRWLSAQLARIHRQLSELITKERKRDVSDRGKAVLGEIEGFEKRISKLRRLAPMKSSVGQAPPDFASLRLLSTPGYREAYRSCLILSSGLKLGTDPLRLSIKDLSLLYEYWCYLSVVTLVAKMTGRSIPVRDLLAIERDGVRVLLQKGKERTVAFAISEERHIAVTYNPLFRGDALLVAQQPDIVLSIRDRHWPLVRIVVDAKYRIDNSVAYLERYHSPGPPDEALNVLHRYRDAIQDSELSNRRTVDGARRTVVEAVALFPYREDRAGAFRSSRLLQSVERSGIGAIPALPGETQYLREWLEDILRKGGWSIADKAIPHHSHVKGADWRIAASDSVLVGVLRGENEREHLNWIQATGQYYVRATGQQRLYSTKYVAIYLPASIRQPGAVALWAPVRSVTVVRRKDIATPWSSSRGDDQQVLYCLDSLSPLYYPIQNQTKDGRSSGPRAPRWTSRLGLLRASNLFELALETEPEWRLYEDLRAKGIPFQILPGKVKIADPDDPSGRAIFLIDGATVSYRGKAGFAVRGVTAEEQTAPDSLAVVELVTRNLHKADL